MSVIIHFLNGNDESIKNHYFQKEYRNDIFLEIHGNFYEVYFLAEESEPCLNMVFSFFISKLLQ